MTSATAPSTRRLFIVGMTNFTIAGLIPSGFGLAVPYFAKLYAMTEVAAGQLLSANGIGAILTVGATVLGVRGLSSRVGLALMGAGFLAFWLMPGFGGKLLAALMIGMGQGIAGVVFNRRFLTEFDARGPGMLSLINAAFGAGAILGPIFILMLGGNVPLAFGLAGFVLLALIPVVQPGSRPPAPLPLLALVNRRWVILIMALCAAMLEVGATGFGPAALIAEGRSPEAAARLLSGFFLAYLVSRLAMFWLVKWMSSSAIFLLSTAGTAASLLLASSGFPAQGYVLAGGFIGIAFPALFVWITRLLGEDNRVSAAILGVSLGGVALAPALLRPIVGQLGIGASFRVIGILAVAVTVMALVALILERRASASARA